MRGVRIEGILRALVNGKRLSMESAGSYVAEHFFLPSIYNTLVLLDIKRSYLKQLRRITCMLK